MNTNWRHFAEFVAVMSVVLSLIFVGFELRLSRAAAEVEMSTTLDSNNLELRTLITDNAGIWYRGCAGDELTPQEQVMFSSIFYASFYHYQMRWSIANAGVVDRPLEGPARRIAMNRYRYPGYEKEYQNHRIAIRNPLNGSVGPVNLYTLIESIYSELGETDIDMNVGFEYSGR